MGDLFCRAAYDSLFLNVMGRVQSKALPQISVDEAADIIVRRERMETPGQESRGKIMIIIMMDIANKPINLST